MPLAFLGGYLSLPGSLYKRLIGIILLMAAARLLAASWKREPLEPVEGSVHPAVLVVCGAAIGLLAGLTGTGGGIFLTPLLLFMRWAQFKRAAAISVAFILVNSLCALLGHWAKLQSLPAIAGYWAVAAVAGGLIGSELGSKRLPHPALRFLLAVVLCVAGGKLLFVSHS
jgi:uncharacterized membrane protein YfcA